MQKDCDCYVSSGLLPPKPYFTFMAVGSSSSGKSRALQTFISNFECFYPNYLVRKLIILAPIWQETSYGPLFEKFGREKCNYYNDLTEQMIENREEIFGEANANSVCIVYCDDMASHLSKNISLEHLATTLVTHQKLLFCISAQSLHQSQSSIWRTVLKNVHIMGISNSPRERLSAQILFEQIFGSNGRKIARAVIKEVTKEQKERYNNGYYFIYLSLHADVDDRQRIFYDFMSNQPIIYVPVCL